MYYYDIYSISRSNILPPLNDHNSSYRAPTELISNLPSIIFHGDHVSEALEAWIELLTEPNNKILCIII